MIKRIAIVGAVVAVVLAGGLASSAATVPSPPRTPAPTHTTALTLGRCPSRVLPLPAEGVARAADQARIQAPVLYSGNGPAVVELAWRATLRLNLWASTPFHCSNTVRRKTVVVDLLFPKMLPSASLSKAVVLVSRFPTGYQVWEIAH